MTATINAPAAPGLSRAVIASAAAQLVDQAGFDSLTVRGVARQLGVSAPSLYEYVASKNELIDLVVATILSDAARNFDPPTEWAALLRYVGRWWHRVLREHPAVYTSVLRRPVAAPVALDTIERVISALVAAGFSLEEAIAAYGQLLGYVVGATGLVQTRADTRAGEGRTETQDRRHLQTRLKSLDPGRYPTVIAARVGLSRLMDERAVHDGIEVLIAGLQQRLTAPRPS